MISPSKLDLSPYRHGVFKTIYWIIFGAGVITIPWPKPTRVTVGPNSRAWDWSIGASQHVALSDDPRDVYLPWLVENVGKRGRDWDWWFETENEYKLTHITRVKIVFRRGKESAASMAVLKWAN